MKRALTHCSHLSSDKLDHLRSIFVSTYGILFLGTPHNGSDMAKLASRVQSISRAMIPKILVDSSAQLLNVLKPDNEVLQTVNRDFANIMKRFNIYFFHETEAMDIKGSRILIVDESSAAPTLDGVERLGIEADHGTMCRFKDQNAPGYMAVKEAIFRYSSEALKEIPLRWHEERDKQLFQLKLEQRRLDGKH